jgi:hypothetical protein
VTLSESVKKAEALGFHYGNQELLPFCNHQFLARAQYCALQIASSRQRPAQSQLLLCRAMPIAAQGMTDALRAVVLLSEAIDSGLGGQRLDQVLAN